MSLLTWTATYLLHSTLCGMAVLVARRRLHDDRALESLWRAAMVLPIVTATIVWWGSGIVRPVEVEHWPALVAARWPSADSSTLLLMDRWIAGSIGVCLLYGVGVLVLDVHRRAAFLRRLDRAVVHDAAVIGELRTLESSAGLDRLVRLTSSRVLASPIAIGTSEIALPARALVELSRRELRACLGHELAHLQRRDERWGYLLAAVHRLLWIQPFNGFARRQLRLLAESACDAWAADRLKDPEGVAQCLVTIAHWPRSTAPLGIHAAGGAGMLTARVHKLLSNGSPPAHAHKLPVRLLVAAGVLALSSIPGIALPQPSAEYWTGFELGRRYRAEHPDEPAARAAARDWRWRIELERQLQKR